MSATLCVANGHCRGVQGLVGTLAIPRHLRQMQGHLLDVVGIEAHQPIELGAVGQGRECLSKIAASKAVKVPFARESRPPGEDGQGDDLTFTQGGLGTRPPRGWVSLAEVVCDDVECGEG